MLCNNNDIFGLIIETLQSEKIPYANEFKRRADLFYAANPDKRPKPTNERKLVSKHKLPESKAVVKSTVKPPNSHRVERREKHKLEFFDDDLPARKKPKSMHRSGTALQTIPEEATVKPIVRLKTNAAVRSVVVKVESNAEVQGSSKRAAGQGSKALPIVLDDDDDDDLPPIVPALRESTRHDERKAAQLTAKGIARHQSGAVSVKSKPPGHTLQSHGFKRTISMPKPQKPILPSFRTCDYCKNLGHTGALVHHTEKGCRIKFRDEMRAHQLKVLQTPEQRAVLAPITVNKQQDPAQTNAKSNATSDTVTTCSSKDHDAGKNDDSHDKQIADRKAETESKQADDKRDKTQTYTNMPARSFINASKLLTSLIRGL